MKFLLLLLAPTLLFADGVTDGTRAIHDTSGAGLGHTEEAHITTT